MSLQRELLHESDRFSPRLRRAFVRATVRMKSRISMRELENALHEKDVRRALKAVREDEIDDVLSALTGILRDSFLRGGKIGAKVL